METLGEHCIPSAARYGTSLWPVGLFCWYRGPFNRAKGEGRVVILYIQMKQCWAFMDVWRTGTVCLFTAAFPGHSAIMIYSGHSAHSWRNEWIHECVPEQTLKAKPLKASRKIIQLFHGGAELPTPISLSLSHWVSFHVYRMLVALSWEKCPAEQKSRGEGHIFLLTGLMVVSDPGEG